MIHPKNLLNSNLLFDKIQYPKNTGSRTAEIKAPDHPIAARMKGEVRFYSDPPPEPKTGQPRNNKNKPPQRQGGPKYSSEVQAMDFNTNDVGQGAVIASVDGRVVAVAWDKGVDLLGAEKDDKGEQPQSSSRIAGLFFMANANPELLSVDAWRMFDASVAWLLASPR